MANSRPSKGSRDNRANQLNPAHPAYHRSRAVPPSEAECVARDIRALLPGTKERAPQVDLPVRILTPRRMP